MVTRVLICGCCAKLLDGSADAIAGCNIVKRIPVANTAADRKDGFMVLSLADE